MSEEIKEKKYQIERTTVQGYKSESYTLTEALKILNSELENKRMIFIDGRPFFGDAIKDTDISKYKKEISVTNRLIGG